jgi:c-di-GMP-binding flagellar brake protein YcgR
MEERRKYERIEISIPIKVKFREGKVCEGKSINISFGGLYAVFDQSISCHGGEKCNISLMLEGEDGIPIDFKGKVNHIEEKRTGFTFLCIQGLDCYEHFKNLMVANSKDPDMLLKELAEQPGLLLEDE